MIILHRHPPGRLHQVFCARGRWAERVLLMRFRNAILLVSALLPVPTLVFGQTIPGYVSSFTVNPPVTAPDAPHATVTATITPESGPVSSLDGMLVSIEVAGSGGVVPIKTEWPAQLSLQTMGAIARYSLRSLYWGNMGLLMWRPMFSIAYFRSHLHWKGTSSSPFKAPAAPAQAKGVEA